MDLLKDVRVVYYALLRDERGASDEMYSTKARTPLELYDELKKLHRFSLPAEHLNVAVNEEFQTWDCDLNSGDTVVFVPPVAGG